MIARAVREYDVAKANADRAAVAEEQISHLVREKSGVRAALEAEQKGLEDAMNAKRFEADEAKAKLEELERLVAQARTSVAEMLSATSAHETYTKECIDKAAAAQREEAQALEDLKARTSEREAAEAEAKAAQARAEELKQSLSFSRDSGMKAVAELTARIAEQAKQMEKAA
jgi:hypothetical protein